MQKIPTKVKNKKLVEQRREKIVMAAIKLFSRSGFHTTTMRELAVEAEISHGNIYEYVSTKEDIFFLIHDYMYGISIESIKQAIQGVKDPLEKLRRMVRSEFNVMYMWADAVLLLYQESHILNKPLLHELLKKEREHIGYFEQAIEECIAEGILKNINVRLVANLIKVMTEAYVVKRWDLRDHVDRFQMEKTILDMIFNYLNQDMTSRNSLGDIACDFSGKTALIINSTTFISNAITTWLISNGAAVTTYQNVASADKKSIVQSAYDAKKVNNYSKIEDGNLDIKLFKDMQLKTGTFDYIIHDLSSYSYSTTSSSSNQKIGKNLETNLTLARELISGVCEDKTLIMPKRVLYIAPWGWDSYADPLIYGMVKSGVSTLVKIMANKLAELNVNINCVSPGFIGGTRPLRIEKNKKQDVIEQVPMNCIGEISDVIGTVQYLLSDESKYVTGQTINVSGGYRG